MADNIDKNDNDNSNNEFNDDDYNVMLTTLDNPYSPFTQFQEWFEFDTAKDYNSLNYLARIVKSSDELSDPDQFEAINQALDEIIELNILGIYIKVTPSSFKDRSKEVNITL